MALIRARLTSDRFVIVERLPEGPLDFTASKPYLGNGKRPYSGLGIDAMQVDLPPKDDKQPSFDLPAPTHLAQVEQYLHLTRTVMPTLAQTSKRHWPVCRDHCFQRIVLDTICGEVWYDHIARPAYKHLSPAQATLAVQLCQQIIADAADLTALNQQSLAWRGKDKTSRL